MYSVHNDMCREIAKLIDMCNTVAIVYHWDSDGIASAAMLRRVYGSRGIATVFIVPRIGIYKVSAIPIQQLVESRPDLVLITDYGIDGREVDELERLLSVGIAVVDHHATNPRMKAFCNPVALGEAEDRYPSTTYVLYRALRIAEDRELMDLVALGIVGDVGWRPRIDLSLWLPGYRKSMDILKRVVDAIDSCYRLGDYNCINYVLNKLSNESIEAVLDDEHLENMRTRVEKEYREVLRSIKPVLDVKQVTVFRINTVSYLTSLLGRELAKRFPNKVVMLVNTVESLGIGYVYVRSLSYRLRHIMEFLRSRGMEVGGKDSVFVVTCRSASCRDEEELVYSAIASYLNGVGGL